MVPLETVRWSTTLLKERAHCAFSSDATCNIQNGRNRGMSAHHIDIRRYHLRVVRDAISNKDGFEVDGRAILGFGLRVAIVHRRCEYGEITTLTAIVEALVEAGDGAAKQPTAYDSPDIWKARPLNCEKDSKKSVMNAATSFAASSVVTTA